MLELIAASFEVGIHVMTEICLWLLDVLEFQLNGL